MGRAPCCDKANVKRGPWSPEEDTALKNYLQRHGTAGNWIALPHRAGLRRCGKSCRLRWLNYLRPDIKHGGFTEEEDNIICSLYKSIGSRWSVIASHLQGRTDNDIKNYWNTKLKKKLFAGKNTSTMKNNISSTNTQFTTSPLSPALLIKSEYGNNHGFSDHFNKNSTTLPLPMDHLNLERNSAGSSQSRDPIHHFPVQISAEALEFGLSANNNTSNASSTPEMESSLSVQSSLENISWWPGNIDDSEYDRLLMDFGFGSSYDLLNGFGYDHDQRISTEAAPSVANSTTLYDNFMVNTSS